MGAAMLCLDFQHAICGPDGALGSASGLSEQVEQRGVLARLADCLAALRAAGLPVLHVGVGFDPGYTRRTNRSARFGGIERAGLMQLGSPDAQFVPQASPVAGESVSHKGCVDPFIGTGLAERLQTIGADEVYLAGVATNFVVESAARHAGDSGLRVTVVEDLCASYTEQMHEFAVTRTLPLFGELCTARELVARVGQGQVIGAEGGWRSHDGGA